MNIDYVGHNYHIDSSVRSHADEKLTKAARFLEEPVDVRVHLEVEKHRQIAQLHVSHRHGVIEAREETSSMIDAINMTVEKIEKQARRSRKKYMAKRRKAQREADNGQHWPIDVVERSSITGGNSPRIIKTSLLPIKPMTIEEAALQLEGSEHDFVVFRDSETALVNVLYKRKDENFGLIAPEF